MSDSGISEASLDGDSKVEKFDVLRDEEEKENDDTFESPIRHLQRNHCFSRSVMNLGTATSSFSYSSTSLNRSTSSVGSSNPVTVSDIRSLTNDYQKLLRKATRDIK